ncbi:Alpha/Beta hydrolase protein [Fusarium solani]|uniref:Alpha/Beta hydrolase protein n=1 Tax=Fusarium solani TaxID=169388 RepID=A0A9P9L999_FUSSL|nr:Alpha/Beta hydrolase protein [Fusarium solani]KAH7276243.1 Alpha/Beta hydrolase protein [Fusarium solani]
MASFIVTVKDVDATVLAQRVAQLDKLEAGTSKSIEVFRDVPAPEYRETRRNGTHGFVKPSELPSAKNLNIETRGGASMALRIIKPATGVSKGTMLHFHADSHPFPASQHDATDSVLFGLSPEGEAKLGGPLRLHAGESAGAYLAVWTAISLRDDHGIKVKERLVGLLCSYGIYDLSYTPSLLRHERNVIVGRESMVRLVDAAFPRGAVPDRKAPNVSPLYADLENLPPALFLCGTADSFVDDSVFLGARWNHLVPEGFHAFSLIPTGEIQKEGVSDVIAFGLSVM